MVVDRGMRDLTVELVQAVCKMVEQVVVPLISNDRKNSSARRAKVLEAITWDNLQQFL